MKDDTRINIVGVIPAHLASVRFPRKILFPFVGLPMIEHVRRRALLCKNLSDVFVATCDREIADAVTGFGGKVIFTSDRHTNGTSRVAEAVENLDCSHVMLLQGDEPLMLPRHVEQVLEQIHSGPGGDAWNATGPIEHAEELDRHSFVKCAVADDNRVICCFRRSPCFSPFETQRMFVRKVLGLIAYRREFLAQLTERPASRIEKAESIEQMRIIENGFVLKSVPVNESLPSVNEPSEADIVLEYIRNNPEQKTLLERIISG
jgi:3-deoxy-manno-octulosonate cytidylyltransferase (CMP-KDO synthetase)